MNPDQIADLALRAGRDMRRVERVRALLDGREWVPAAEVGAALEGGHSVTCSGIVDLAGERPRAVALTTVSPGASPQDLRLSKESDRSD